MDFLLRGTKTAFSIPVRYEGPLPLGKDPRSKFGRAPLSRESPPQVL